ncbi:hypothetical protein [Cellulomonas sp. SLBN-39]|uniref:hypothetical protein n=1 Tax=Cellulomonas sp. SLBN-39 TaxID=2768446 RepID=UPI0021030C2E|nr:hypothetical protein [Cellulomonas sp. SLBN-39]
MRLVESLVDELGVDVTGGASEPVRSEQHAALQHEVVAMARLGQARKEPLKCVQRDDLAERALLLGGHALQRGVRLSWSHAR